MIKPTARITKVCGLLAYIIMCNQGNVVKNGWF